MLPIIWFLRFFLLSGFCCVFLPTTLTSLPPGVMLLSRSTAPRDSATYIKKTSRKGALEQERLNRSVVKTEEHFTPRSWRAEFLSNSSLHKSNTHKTCWIHSKLFVRTGEYMCKILSRKCYQSARKKIRVVTSRVSLVFYEIFNLYIYFCEKLW